MRLVGMALAALASGGGDEARYYVLEPLVAPEGEVLEVGGMDFLSDGRLVVSTRRGRVWIVEDALAPDPGAARFVLFADGLQDGLGLAVVDDEIYVVQRGELSRLLDKDEDGLCDRVETVCQDWGLSGNYHEFAFGLPRAADDRLFVALNLGFFDPEWWHGQSRVPWRGWVLAVDSEGRAEPYACGFRSPCGMGLDARGELFVTDNQGDWIPACPVLHVKPGRFYGHPASLDWTAEYRASATHASDTVPPDRERAPAACWLPYKWSRSAGNLVADTTGGRFGPFGEQLFVAELTNGLVLRVQLEEVRGEQQGACFLFRQELGSVCRVAFAPDGSLFLGLTNRGWGGRAPAHGLARLRWTGEVPFEMRSVHLIQKGFEIELTKPIDLPPRPADVVLTQYDYDYWWEYGSPERDTERLPVRAVMLSPDRRTVTLLADGLRAGRVARLVLSGVVSQDGEPLLHDELAYTVNQLPEGPLSTEHVAKAVPPPPARESEDEGWLRLTWGDALDAWESEGWELCDAELDPRDPTRLATRPGNGALANTASGEPSDFVSRYAFSDFDLRLAFLLPEGGESAIRLPGRYEVVLSGDPARCGAVAAAGALHAPAGRAAAEAGQWHELTLAFRAARFDAEGRPAAPAVIEELRIDGAAVHERLELQPGDEPRAPGPERGPLVLAGGLGPAAFGNVRVRPERRVLEETGTPLFEGGDLDLVEVRGELEAESDFGVVVLSGGPGSVATLRDDVRDVTLRAGIKISEGGLADVVLRAAVGEDGAADGYAVRLNASHPDPQRTGSVVGAAPVRVQLVGADTWCALEVRCRDEAGGTRLSVLLNGVRVAEHLDQERRYQAGRIAFVQRHASSVLELRDVWVVGE